MSPLFILSSLFSILFSLQGYVELEESVGRTDRGEFVLSPTGEAIRVRKEEPGAATG